MKLQDFVNQCNTPAKLVRAVVRQSGGWEYFKESASDIAQHGAAGGFSGFIYYTDTVAFTKRNKPEIMQSLQALADDMGVSLDGLLAGFGGFEGETVSDIMDGLYNHRSDNRQMVYNVLAWYALEEVAREYCDALERV